MRVGGLESGTELGRGGGVELVAALSTSRREREFFIDNLLVRIHLIMSQMFLVDQPRAMGV